jgi:hypothetical protein
MPNDLIVSALYALVILACLAGVVFASFTLGAMAVAGWL